jgi:hypothetical protein
VLKQIVAELRWEQRSGIPAALYAELVERLAGAFRSTLGRIDKGSAALGAALHAQARACPPASLLRFLTAPETFHRFSSRGTEPEYTLAFIEESIAAELHRCGASLRIGRPVCTALGDYHILDTADRLGAPSGQIKVAPLVGGIPVDFDSPYAFGIDMPGSGTECPVPTSERDWLVGRLDEALSAINQASPHAFALVRLFTRVIVPSRDTESGVFLSSSSPRLVGKTVLSNAECASREALADAVVHESIHAMLSAEQLRMPFVLDHADLSEEAVTSPWTGALIPMDAFVDACFVWFALWNFWNLPAVRIEFEHWELKRLRQQSRSGFDGPPLVGVLTGHEKALSPPVLDAIAEMQRVVQHARPRVEV